LPVKKFGEPTFDPVKDIGVDVKATTLTKLRNLLDAVESEYPNIVIPTLFKNLTKCRRLAEICTEVTPAS
jgi:hypothetical protein